MLLPNLAKQDNAYLSHVATTRSLSAVNAQRRFGFTTASTTADAVLDDESLDAIFIVTRHHTHADLVCRALETGKAVFVEKPLALTESELERVIDVIAKTGNDRLMVGFNRRFAPLLAKMQSEFGQPRNATARYLVNAGPLAADSWYTNEELEGSRFAGEGGHFIDTLSWWAGSLPAEVYALSGPEKGDVHATVRFQNGSTGTISYITGGNPRYPEGDARRRGRAGAAPGWTTSGRRRSGPGGRQNAMKSRGGPDKGQQAELEKFVEACLHRRADADSRRVAGGHDPGHDRGRREPAEQPPGAGVSGSPVSRLGWYARRIARMSPAEVAWRARDQAVQVAWTRRQVRRGQAAGRPAVSRRAQVQRRAARRAPPRRYPSRPGRPCSTPRTGC